MKFSNKMIDSAKRALYLTGVLWVVHLYQYFTGTELGFLGIFPREIWGLKGIVMGPLIHADWHHLFSNSIPILMLTTMTFLFYNRVALRSFLMIYFLTGITVWVFGREVFHIGASGVVYGLVSFIFWNGIFRKSLQSIVLALIITFLYSGYFAGILPNQEGISWESHLLGGLVGIFVAYYFKEEIELEEKAPLASWEMAPNKETTYFLKRDIFEKTKEERRREEEQRREEERQRAAEQRRNNYPDWYSSSTYEDW